MEATPSLGDETTPSTIKTEPLAGPQNQHEPSKTDEPVAPEQKNETPDPSGPPAKKAKTEILASAREPPVHEMVGGSSVRQYLNKHLTEHLLEGLKDVSAKKPEDPLLALGEFLVQRSKELNGK
ncbi:hypothetical protein METBIDRAFT_13213 [Metschnikowia bicuspidata var. bicuspidata NRRL YB-4993]|uniref:Uncharacterized protein n=1 Tax=Metschnikowia bicuspidata var. bicuspidata NRRL YB-4993 TaxID=869754 RepID=A0A1A0H666_9ASCO|nr:hypothetical protein METBIDRAFT_13213 [Metschnikowia bicuspidata var. bicuspidata NRRL YB-4993]OBA19450.1 hypothetical protein METBIDRAFT_13213 [Metschnikowia bicuspidata var. bicuspidata NRRL YB-4993]